jgi:hypothetical protein
MRPVAAPRSSRVSRLALLHFLELRQNLALLLAHLVGQQREVSQLLMHGLRADLLGVFFLSDSASFNVRKFFASEDSDCLFRYDKLKVFT